MVTVLVGLGHETQPLGQHACSVARARHAFLTAKRYVKDAQLADVTAPESWRPGKQGGKHAPT